MRSSKIIEVGNDQCITEVDTGFFLNSRIGLYSWHCQRARFPSLLAQVYVYSVRVNDIFWDSHVREMDVTCLPVPDPSNISTPKIAD